MFTFDSYHESVHLCNNAIQSRYANGRRSAHLPEENMWSCEQFIEFLRIRGLQDYWDTKIYPGMKNSIIGKAYYIYCTIDSSDRSHSHCLDPRGRPQFRPEMIDYFPYHGWSVRPSVHPKSQLFKVKRKSVRAGRVDH